MDLESQISCHLSVVYKPTNGILPFDDNGSPSKLLYYENPVDCWITETTIHYWDAGNSSWGTPQISKSIDNIPLDSHFQH